jgi:flagellar motor switch protein FliM
VAVEGVDLSPEELARMEAGDILSTDSDADGEVIVRIDGVPRFAARLGSADGRRAITITRRLD